MQERLTSWRHLDTIDLACCCKGIIHASGPDIFVQHGLPSAKIDNDPDLPEDYRDLTSGFNVAMPTSPLAREVFPEGISVAS
jgi:hypothetical protein